MQENRLSTHIMTTSATMVGVTMTIVSIVNLAAPSARGGIADEILAIDALVFLASVITSYLSLRQHDVERADVIERYADRLFIIGMVLLVGAGLWFVFRNT